MSDPGLHLERTELAWSRTWLAAIVGVALSLRSMASHGLSWHLVVAAGGVVVVCALATDRRDAVPRAAALCVIACLIGSASIVSVALRLT